LSEFDLSTLSEFDLSTLLDLSTLSEKDQARYYRIKKDNTGFRDNTGSTTGIPTTQRLGFQRLGFQRLGFKRLGFQRLNDWDSNQGKRLLKEDRGDCNEDRGD
jgi:hypothetical protein